WTQRTRGRLTAYHPLMPVHVRPRATRRSRRRARPGRIGILPVPLRPILAGLATYVPGVYHLRPKRTGGTSSAEYCYGVWIKHLTLARHHGLARIPHTIAELGPGDSLGVGLAALLSGVDRYYSFDVVRYSEAERNLQIFE